MKFVAGSLRYVLEKDTIIIQHMELVDYHRNIEDWRDRKRIRFANENDALEIFSCMKNMFDYGVTAGKKHSRSDIETKIKQVFNDMRL